MTGIAPKKEPALEPGNRPSDQVLIHRMIALPVDLSLPLCQQPLDLLFNRFLRHQPHDLIGHLAALEEKK